MSSFRTGTYGESYEELQVNRRCPLWNLETIPLQLDITQKGAKFSTVDKHKQFSHTGESAIIYLRRPSATYSSKLRLFKWELDIVTGSLAAFIYHQGCHCFVENKVDKKQPTAPPLVFTSHHSPKKIFVFVIRSMVSSFTRRNSIGRSPLIRQRIFYTDLSVKAPTSASLDTLSNFGKSVVNEVRFAVRC